MNIRKTCALAISSMILSCGCAFADGNAFTPLNFDDTAYSVPNSTTKTTNTVNSVQQNNNSGFVDTSAVNTSQATGNADLQPAIAVLLLLEPRLQLVLLLLAVVLFLHNLKVPYLLQNE